MGKGEIAHNEQFLLFPQCFLPIWITLCYQHLKQFKILVCKLFQFGTVFNLSFGKGFKKNEMYHPISTTLEYDDFENITEKGRMVVTCRYTLYIVLMGRKQLQRCRCNVALINPLQCQINEIDIQDILSPRISKWTWSLMLFLTLFQFLSWWPILIFFLATGCLPT